MPRSHFRKQLPELVSRRSVRDAVRLPASLYDPPNVHEKRIEIRWRDVDAYRHVNNAVYLTYLEECRDEWLATVLGSSGGLWDFVLARVAIDFRRELRQEDDTVLVRCRLARVGISSVTTREEIRTETDELSAEAEAVLVARDPETGRPRPLTDAERAALERAL